MSVVTPEPIIMDTSAITSLAALLRRSGYKILNGESKFILSAQHLSTINTLFSSSIEQREIYNASFHVIPGRSGVKLEVYRDLQFLYDFIQRALSLKLTTDCKIPDNFTVNISRFKSIKLLDLQKLPVESVTGIRQLRSQVQFLNCTRSTKSLAALLEFGGGDHCSGFVWSELREAIFCHNSLTHIDSSLQYTPWLITLDLSHNELTDLSALNSLENLKHLNVGYNKLTNLPTFNNMLSAGLQVLVLRANFLESITPLARITHLRDLDLSDNCLLEHTTSLIPLAHLSNLQHLALQGNPLAHHPRHRACTCRHLHRNTATVRFVLDGEPIGGRERELVGIYRPVLSSCLTGDITENTIEGDDQNNCSSIATSDIKNKRAKSKRRARDAVISDSDENGLTDSIIGDGSHSSLTNITNIMDEDHLTTKRQIELLREQFGDNWLQAQAGSLVQEALGLERSDIATVADLSSTPYDDDFMLHAADVPRCNGPIIGDKTVPANVQEVATVNDDESALPRGTVSQSPADVNHRSDADADISDDEEIDEGEQNLYLGTVDGYDEPVFLIVTSTHLTEREWRRTRERARWPLATLNRCTYAEEDHSFLLEFDTMRTDRKQRRYVIKDDEEATRLNKAFQSIVERNSADESKFISYTCMKCSSKFNTDKNHLYGPKQTVTCPFCKISLAIQDS